MSRAVVTCWKSGSPLALRKTVFVIPIWRAFCVIIWAKRSLLPPSVSPIIQATSLAERVTRARMACSTEIELPGGMPSFEGDCEAASALITMRLSSVMRPSRNASNSR
ncbi:hypothetical protein ROTAS13_01910 [Roseomonas sp. TAS13]|nr:hypothetical protein ROTAS13_01910 [Roseomonas sp. TAS13]